MFSSRHGAFGFLLRLVVFLALLGGLGEIWFRSVMPACEAPAFFMDSEWLIQRRDPSGPTSGLFTVGRYTAEGGFWRVNSEGWISLQDYHPPSARNRPLIAVFGDSFVEGLDTDIHQHLDVYLSDAFGGDVDVYSFGIGNWSLEQHVAVSRYVAASFDPDVMIILLDNNDVRDSVRDYGVVSPFLWQIEADEQGFQEVKPALLYAPSALRDIAGQWSLLNYLRYNAGVVLWGGGNSTAVEAAEAGWEELLPAATFMVDLLSREHPGVPILFASHLGVKISAPEIDERYLPPSEVESYPLFADARSVQHACRKYGDIDFLDLRVAFAEDWAVNAVRFESADGRHWNAYANRLVAESLAAYIQIHRLLALE